MEPEKRSLLKPLCVIKLIPIALIRIAALVFAILTSQTIHDYCHCLDGPNYTLTYEVCPNYSTLFALIRGLLVILLLEVTVATGVAVYIMMRIFRPIYRIRMLIGMSIQRTRLRTNDVTVTRGGGWRFCCRVCCAASSILSCCMLGGYEAVTSDFMDVSLALEDLFDDGGLLDVTLSDIVHGLVLLAQEQREKREARRKELAEATLVLDNRHMPSMTMRRRSRSSSMYFEKTERLLLGRREERDRVILDEAGMFLSRWPRGWTTSLSIVMSSVLDAIGAWYLRLSKLHQRLPCVWTRVFDKQYNLLPRVCSCCARRWGLEMSHIGVSVVFWYQSRQHRVCHL